MQENFPKNNEEESLRDENAFLKMKLMLEHGMQGEKMDPEIPPEIEHIFLKNIDEFEKQYRNAKRIKIFDKIGSPDHFRPVGELSDEEIGRAWEELCALLNEQSIDIDVCSPNISIRELYRFTTEELFEQETEDIRMPGWVNHYIYDEFHPDPVYDNTRSAENFLSALFDKKLLDEFAMVDFRKSGLTINGKHTITSEELVKAINHFKNSFDDILFQKKNAISCIVQEDQCTVSGSYFAEAISGEVRQYFSGAWEMKFERNADSKYWYIIQLQIENMRFW